MDPESKKEKKKKKKGKDDPVTPTTGDGEGERRDKKKKPKKLGEEGGDLPADSRVRVAVRIRPFGKADQGNTESCLDVSDGRIKIDNGQRDSSFTYDHVFQCSQVDVYASVGEGMLSDTFSGYNTCIFAYGQTGSGKTYSMLGGDTLEEEGLLPRICRELFQLTEELTAEDPTLIIKIQVSFVEVYNEKIHDLLQFEGSPMSGKKVTNDDLAEIKLKEDKKHKTFFVDNLSLHTVLNYNRIRRLIDDGTDLRAKAETGMNELSSRSHSVFTVYVSQTHEPPNPTIRDKASKITIVDLAGSERQSKTGPDMDAKKQKEAEKINMSLLVLGRCLNSSSSEGKTENRHIPIRESVLTKMLCDIFGGNSKTIMFATVSPSLYNATETLSTLQYAYNAKKIKHKAKVNNLAKAVEIKELKEQVKALGKTLIEELEKAAYDKSMLDHEIQALTSERDLAVSALKTSHEDCDMLKDENEALKRENRELREGRGTPLTGSSWASSPATNNSVGHTLSESADFRQDSTTDVDDDEDEADRGIKLQALADELSSKLCRANPNLPSGSGFSTHRSDASSLPMSARTVGSMLSAQNGQEGTQQVKGQEIRSYIGHRGAIYCCAFSPNGDKMISSSRDTTLKIWHLKSGAEVGTLKGHNGFVLSCEFSPDGKYAISASDDKTVKIWDTSTGKKVQTLRGHSDKVYSATFSPTNTVIATASCDKTVRIWSVETWKKLKVLRGHSSAVFCVAFSHDSAKVVSASDDKTLKLWDYNEEKELAAFQGHTGTVWSCQFSPNDDIILSCSIDGLIKCWDIETSFCIKTYRGHNAPVHHAIFAKDGQKIISASRDNSLKIWDTQEAKVLATLNGHKSTVYHCAVYGNLILSCSSDDTLKVWNLEKYC